MKQMLLAHIFSDGTRFKMSPADPCLFVRGDIESPDSPYVAISTHVDDKFIACRHPRDKDAVAKIFSGAKWNFTMKLMDKVLGVHIKYFWWDPAPDTPGV